MLGVANALKNTAIAFDGSCRGKVVREAGNKETVQAQVSPGLLEHLAQRPTHHAASTRGGTYAVADLPEGVVECVPQGHPAENLAVFDDPPRRAVLLVRARRSPRMGQPDLPMHPMSEAIRRIHVVVSAQAEAVLVHAGASVVAALQKCSVQADGRQYQFGHAADGNAGPAAGPACLHPTTTALRGPSSHDDGHP